MSVAVTWDQAQQSYNKLQAGMEKLRSDIGARTDKDRELTETELERETSMNDARAAVDEAYESLPDTERKKAAEPTDHDRYLSAEVADKDGEYPKRIVELNRAIKTLGMDIETGSYDINIETNMLRYFTAVETGLNPTADPHVLAQPPTTSVISDPGRDEKVK